MKRLLFSVISAHALCKSHPSQSAANAPQCWFLETEEYLSSWVIVLDGAEKTRCVSLCLFGASSSSEVWTGCHLLSRSDCEELMPVCIGARLEVVTGLYCYTHSHTIMHISYLFTHTHNLKYAHMMERQIFLPHPHTCVKRTDSACKTHVVSPCSSAPAKLQSDSHQINRCNHHPGMTTSHNKTKI